MSFVKTIRPMAKKEHTAHVPGSKSETHRALICAALASGQTIIENGLVSEDTQFTREGLRLFGAKIQSGEGRDMVTGVCGRPSPCEYPIYLGNSGTSMRLLTAVAAIGRGSYLLDGSPRIRQRPIGDLVEALRMLDVEAVAQSQGQCPPVRVTGRVIKKRRTRVNCRLSSQFLSGLLLIAPMTKEGLVIEVSQGPVSRPYIDMTVAVMKKFGIKLVRDSYKCFEVPGGQPYLSGTYKVEPDASGASYFWAAGAVTGNPVTVAGIRRDSVQGDARFVDVLGKMGCKVEECDKGLMVQGGDLRGVCVDMGDMPDMVPTLAMVAAFAKGQTRIFNVAHLAAKESDRLSAVVTELSRMGVKVEQDGDSISIHGGHPKEACISTYDDHRIAMSFAVAGLLTPGLRIGEAQCVSKSFPGFWDQWEKLYQDA